MKKVLIICGGLQFGGVERFATNIIRYAPQDEFIFDYLVFEGLGDAFAPEIESKGGRIITLPSPSKGYFQYIHNLLKLMKQNQYDVVHSHTQFNTGLNLLAAKRMEVPIRIAHSHTTAHEHKISAVKRLYENTMRFLIRHCVTHQCACGQDAGYWMFGDTPFTVIHNGIDADAFRFSEINRETIRSKYSIPESSFVIGHTGTLSELKNQELLIRIMPDILKLKKDAYLLLIGRGHNDFQAYLESIAEQCGIKEKVMFTGAVMNVYEYLSAFDAFAFPSLREGTPISLIEAQANGLPCVISDRIPQDAVITDLVKAVPLEKREEWISVLCQATRKDSEQYASLLNTKGYGIYSAMEPLYQIYRGK